MTTPSRQTVTIVNARGLHARAAAKFVALAGEYDAFVILDMAGHRVPADSIMEVLMLAAAKGAVLDIETTGPEADAALNALVALVTDGFGEG